MQVDDILVYSTDWPVYDVQLVRFSLPYIYLPVGNHHIGVTIHSDGTTVLNSVNVHWSIDGRKTFHTRKLDNLKLPMLGTCKATLPKFLQVQQEGVYLLEVWLTQPNGETDEDSSDNNGSTDVFILSNSAVRNVLFEEWTGEWSGWCPAGAIELDKTLASFPGRVIPVSHHEIDDLDPANLRSMRDSLDLSAFYPAGVVDRYPYEREISLSSPTMAVDRNEFQDAVARSLARLTSASVFADVKLDRATRRLTVNAQVHFVAEDRGDMRFQCILTTCSVRRDRRQRNSYNNDPTTYPELYNAGDPIRNWSHRHVSCAIIGGAAGTGGDIPPEVSGGSSYSHLYTCTVPVWYNIDSIGVVVFVSKYRNKDITRSSVLNANAYLNTVMTDVTRLPESASMHATVYPNPVDDVAYLRVDPADEGDPAVCICDVYGHILQNIPTRHLSNLIRLDLRDLSAGVYFAHFTSRRATVSRLIVKR